jgi:hypothetical protein
VKVSPEVDIIAEMERLYPPLKPWIDAVIRRMGEQVDHDTLCGEGAPTDTCGHDLREVPPLPWPDEDAL